MKHNQITTPGWLMRKPEKLDQTDLKIIASFLVLIFLFSSLVLVIKFLPTQRSLQPQAASQSFYSQESDGYVHYQAKGIYPPDPTGICSTGATASVLYVGQQLAAGGYYNSLRSYLLFDTSAIPADVTVTGATLQLKLASQGTDTDFILKIGGGSGAAWGPTVECADWNKLGTINSTTFNTANLPASGSTFSISIDPGLVIKSGLTYLVLISDREQNNTVPTGSEMFGFYSGNYADKPQLIVNYTTPPPPPPPPPPPKKPTVSISANPSVIKVGQSTTLTWSSSEATSVLITPDVGTVGTSGSKTVRPASTTTYKAVATGLGGESDPAYVLVTVKSDSSPPPSPSPPDTTLPTFKITDQQVVVGFDKITFSWKTSEPATSVIEYGLSKKLGMVFSDSKLAKNHEVTLASRLFIPSTTYYFQLKGKSEKGAEAASQIASFKTKGYSVKIKVTDPQGKPLSGVKVVLFSIEKESKTDQIGIATFRDVPPGKHKVEIWLGGKRHQEEINVRMVGTSANFQEFSLTIPASKEAGTAKLFVGAFLIFLFGAAVCFILWQRRKNPFGKNITFVRS